MALIYQTVIITRKSAAREVLCALFYQLCSARRVTPGRRSSGWCIIDFGPLRLGTAGASLGMQNKLQQYTLSFRASNQPSRLYHNHILLDESAFVLASQFPVVTTFNQEKALVREHSVIIQLQASQRFVWSSTVDVISFLKANVKAELQKIKVWPTCAHLTGDRSVIVRVWEDYYLVICVIVTCLIVCSRRHCLCN